MTRQVRQQLLDVRTRLARQRPNCSGTSQPVVLMLQHKASAPARAIPIPKDQQRHVDGVGSLPLEPK